MQSLAIEAPTSLQIASGDAVMGRGDAEMAVEEDDGKITPTRRKNMHMRPRDRTPKKDSGKAKK